MKTRHVALRLAAIPLLLAPFNLPADTHYVCSTSAYPTPPYTNWTTAATNINDAMYVTQSDDVVLVTNGVYTGEVYVFWRRTLRSVNGPQHTVIEADPTPYLYRTCASLEGQALLSGFTLTNGAGEYVGGVHGDSWGSQGEARVVTNCVIAGNWAEWGVGGAEGVTLYNCILANNRGGASGCTLYNCLLTGNQDEPAAAGCTLYNCTLTGNSASSVGGAYDCTLYNCIVYGNTVQSEGANYDSASTLNYCCTLPLPTNGTGNLGLDPQLASLSHLSANSPCRGAGRAAFATGTDIDGEPWANPPSIGCDEFQPGAVTGPLTVGLRTDYVCLPPGYAMNLTALIEGRTTRSLWDLGDGTTATNKPIITHAWATPGDYRVLLWAFNETYPEGVCATLTVHVGQRVHFVNAANPNPVWPFTSWATAATNIQDAVDAAGPAGSEVLVTNGLYAGGSRAVAPFAEPSRVRVDRPLTLRSVNGPPFTIIDGGGEMRCIYLTNGAVLMGFTLTNGVSGDGGGVWGETTAVVTNCLIVGNSAVEYGGGACGGTLNNCTLTDNSASYGGGTYGATLNNCTLTDNSASDDGGGADFGTLNNCTLTGNSATYGGGAYGATLNNCTLTDNSASYGGGAYSGALNNCISYYNHARVDAANYSASTLNYCCTLPLPTNGTGNITLDPQLASLTHLSANSPCRGAGSAAHATGTDIDGEPWANPPAIGCDELQPGAVTGPLTVGIPAGYVHLAPGYAMNLTAQIAGRTTQSLWDFGDGTSATNQPYTAHAWTTPGDYRIALWAFNETLPEGVCATLTIHVAQSVHFVDAANPNPVWPFTSWASAATNIQDAVDAAGPGLVVWVTNGVYASGVVTVKPDYSRVRVDRPLALRSVNGPQFTLIDGGAQMRCVDLANGSVLSGFTLTNGYAHEGGGGGVRCEATVVVSNCLVVGNSAVGYGGGAYGGSLYDCALSNNTAQLTGSGFRYYSLGGGAQSSTLYRCTLNNNGAMFGGGAAQSRLNNCTLASNSAGGGGGAIGCTLDNCMLTDNWAGNIGGAVWGGTLNACTLVGNQADYHGGGSFDGTLNNCTVVSNSAAAGGGSYGGTLNNCIVYFNTCASGQGKNYDPATDPTLNFCCTTPLPAKGVGNITSAPLFVNLRLQSNSPCINAGNNAYACGDTDLDGNPRIAGATVDIGAYEFQGEGLSGFTAWLWQYGQRIDGSANAADPDQDHLSNWQEWVCATCPTNSQSALRLLSPTLVGTNLRLTWSSVAGVDYYLERTTDLASPFSLLATNLVWQEGFTSFEDTNCTIGGPFFYRVGVTCRE